MRRLFRRDGGIEPLRLLRHLASDSATHEDVEAGAAILYRRRQAKVVDLGSCAVMPTAAYRDVELARQVAELFSSKHRSLDRPHHRRRVEDLIRVKAGHWAAGDIADVIHARLPIFEAGFVAGRS